MHSKFYYEFETFFSDLQEKIEDINERIKASRYKLFKYILYKIEINILPYVNMKMSTEKMIV